MDQKLKDQRLKEDIAYAMAIRYVNKYRIKNGIEQPVALEFDRAVLSSLVEDIIKQCRGCEHCKELVEHYDGIRKYWND